MAEGGNRRAVGLWGEAKNRGAEGLSGGELGRETGKEVMEAPDWEPVSELAEVKDTA